MRRLISLITFILIFFGCKHFHGQENYARPYWVFFTEKDTTHFDPYSFFDKKAIQRRLRNHIALYDYDDIPVKSEYIESVRNLCDSVIYPSRWFNAVYIYANESQITQITSFPFVKEVQPAFIDSIQFSINDTLNFDFYSQHFMTQLSMMNANIFLDSGFLGQNVRIAVFDAGFPGVDTILAFKHLRDKKKIIATYDFRKKKEFVYDYNQHGTMVLSCIAGLVPVKKSTARSWERNEAIDTFQFYYHGIALNAEFLLARTEIAPEVKAEEIYWIAALEWADQLGADIVNSSLGYTYHRYFPYQMDGKTTLISKAAAKAMKKGILVINAAGNDGNKAWHVIGAPADADSIISVGGVGPDNMLATNFSSRGPTADGRLKPDVCAAGWAYTINKNGKSTYAAGTSFAAPLVTGFAACLLSADSTTTSSQLYQKLRESGHLYPYFDYAHGYGIPTARKAFKLDTTTQSFDVKTTSDSITFTILKNKLPFSNSVTSDTSFLDRYFYIHCEGTNGILKWYEAYPVSSVQTISYPINQFKKGEVIRCFYHNQYFEYKF
ncbi:MAG: S8 family serine peptidase [Bacteroidales bacterium]|nr:S8 family serine peptidase [Bacteroidales bacterium]